MKCIYCQEQAGFLKTYHETCKISSDETQQAILRTAQTACANAKKGQTPVQVLRNLVLQNPLYESGLSHTLYSQDAIRTNETILYTECGLTILESKNRCTMVRTGYRYEKMPTWSERTALLCKNAVFIITDKAIYLQSMEGTMRYAYQQIVNIGQEKFNRGFYFDVKTTSPFPHRFLLKTEIVLDNEKTNHLFSLMKYLLDWPQR